MCLVIEVFSVRPFHSVRTVVKPFLSQYIYIYVYRLKTGLEEMFISLENQPDDEPPTLQKKCVSMDIEMSVVILGCTFRRLLKHRNRIYL